MTNQEALDIFVSCATLDCDHCNMSFRGCESKPKFNVMRDMVISALEKQTPKEPVFESKPKFNIMRDMVISALEKQTLKEPIFESDGYADGSPIYDTWHCPECDTEFDINDKYKYCPNCGQRIDIL